ncbi:uncharacterized protein LOC143274700 [Babylonia areolata]|uniref:uncharacterized protein LOC143274700 n=1 Tax=Babylonia areolata TaxID=304850 RepID=UPI003FD2C556
MNYIFGEPVLPFHLHASLPNMESEKKRVRNPNYLPAEVSVLLQEIASNKDLILSTSITDEISQKKNELWARISTLVSDLGVCRRSPEHVREKFTDMKKDFYSRLKKAKEINGVFQAPARFYDEQLIHIIGRDLPFTCVLDTADLFKPTLQLIYNDQKPVVSSGAVNPANVHSCTTSDDIQNQVEDFLTHSSAPDPDSTRASSSAELQCSEDAACPCQSSDQRGLNPGADQWSPTVPLPPAHQEEGHSEPESAMQQRSPFRQNMKRSGLKTWRRRAARRTEPGFNSSCSTWVMPSLQAEYLRAEIEKMKSETEQNRVKTRLLLLEEIKLKRELGLV